MTKRASSLPFLLSLAAALAATPAVAQKGHGHGHDDRARVERHDDRRDDRRYDHRTDSRFERRSDSGSHRGWCQGVGNPHNTAANCGYRGSRTGTYDRSRTTRTYDRYGHYTRNGVVYNRDGSIYSRNGTLYNQRYNGYGTTSGYGSSYGTSHQAYHDQHDRQCRALASQRPNDLQWQLRVRTQCSNEHTQWHQRFAPRR